MGAEPGITGDRIRLGTHTSLTGPLAAYGQVALAAGAVFEHVNSTGGVHGRSIEWIIRDDGYDPTRTREVVRELIDDIGVAAIVMGSGTPTHLAVVDQLDARGIPDLWVISGSKRMSEPRRARSFVGNVSYARMAAALAEHLAGRGAGPVALLCQDSPVGDEFHVGVGEALARHVNPPILQYYPHDLGASLAVDVDRAVAAGAEVALCMATPEQVVGAIGHATRRGHRMCWASVFTDGLIDALGPSAEGLISCHWLVLPEHDDGAAVRAHASLMRLRAPQVAITGTSVGGEVLARATIEVLRRAGPQLTRSGIVAAAESLTGWTSPLCLGAASCSADDHALFGSARSIIVDGGRWRLA